MPKSILYELKLICDYAHNTNKKIFNYIWLNRRQASIPYTVFWWLFFNQRSWPNLFNGLFYFVFKSSNISPPDSSSLPIPPFSLDNIPLTEAVYQLQPR